MNRPTKKHHLLDPLSLSSVYLELLSENFQTGNKDILGFATGFIIQRTDNYYLITNWHVLTGKNSDTNQPIHNAGALPSIVRIHLFKNVSTLRIDWGFIDISLEPSPWIEHPEGRFVDVVALPLPSKIDFELYALDLSLSQTDIKCFPGVPVSVIGFPCGLKGGGYFPIWSTGYMATEFCINVENKPLFYANVSGRKGLSGSPVVARAIGSCMTTQGGLDIFPGIRTKFMGIYSGRAKEGTDVCRVWKAEVIQELKWPVKVEETHSDNLIFQENSSSQKF